jgi:hypothetical protein
MLKFSLPGGQVCGYAWRNNRTRRSLCVRLIMAPGTPGQEIAQQLAGHYRILEVAQVILDCLDLVYRGVALRPQHFPEKL